MTIRRMGIACCIPNATNAHSEYVILTVFLLQQWLHRRASILHYTSTASLVLNITVSWWALLRESLRLSARQTPRSQNRVIIRGAPNSGARSLGETIFCTVADNFEICGDRQWRTQEFCSGGGGSTNSVEDRGQRERGSGGGSPLVRGSGGSCSLVQ